jgi:hypothetical protein
MASQGDPTQRRASAPPSTPPAPPSPPEGIDLTTLFLSAVASAAAAYVTSKIWAPGTLFSAAMSPVIVALVKEGLRKPTEVVTAAVPGVAKPLRVSSASRVGAARGVRVPSDPRPVHHTLPDDLPDRLEGGAPPPLPPPQAGAQAGPVRVYSTRGNRMRLRVAVVTGLLAFALVVAFYTVPELIAGQSVGRSGHATTFFPGKAEKHTKSTTTTSTSTTQSNTTTSGTTTSQSKTATQPTQTVTQTVTTPAPPPPDTSTTPIQPAPQQTPTTAAPVTPGQPPAATTP